tara:strand:- start:482 stop:1078 length:597 start_codon:yes stop_codon:yes gene_type:complete
MIDFKNLSKEIPYLVLKEKYDEAIKAKQKNIEAICISSYSAKYKEVRARFVNLKFVNNKEFIFFSNYESPKSEDFISHNQITGLIYWNSTNVQIRMKANVKKTDKKYNNTYFSMRDRKKNALAISSNQSVPVDSYETVVENYMLSLKNNNLSECPNNWGGYTFTPYYFEFWQGHESRLNKREVYDIQNNEWVHCYLEP